MTDIRPLDHTPIAAIHAAFVDAFSGYEVPLQLTLEKFQEMVKTRDLDLNRSLGIFDGDILAGFVLCGYRTIDGRVNGYDGGTGVIQVYQKQGLGHRLLEALLPMLKQQQVAIFVLEVLENNLPAIQLYQKFGFHKVRKLMCFERQRIDEVVPIPSELRVMTDKQAYRALNQADFLSYQPSWQNFTRSVLNNFDAYGFVGLQQGDNVIGYGLVHKVSGDILQLGLLQPWRNQGLEQVLLYELGKLTQGSRLTLLNIPEEDELARRLPEWGFDNFISQWEMQLDLVDE